MWTGINSALTTTSLPRIDLLWLSNRTFWQHARHLPCVAEGSLDSSSSSSSSGGGGASRAVEKGMVTELYLVTSLASGPEFHRKFQMWLPQRRPCPSSFSVPPERPFSFSIWPCSTRLCSFRLIPPNTRPDACGVSASQLALRRNRSFYM